MFFKPVSAHCARPWAATAPLEVDPTRPIDPWGTRLLAVRLEAQGPGPPHRPG